MTQGRPAPISIVCCQRSGGCRLPAPRYREVRDRERVNEADRTMLHRLMAVVAGRPLEELRYQ
jgi:hypothetical protein